MCRASLAAAGLSATLVACCPQPRAPEVIRVVVPADLTAPCLHEADPETVGELYLAYADARLELRLCNDRMDRIRRWSDAED